MVETQLSLWNDPESDGSVIRSPGEYIKRELVKRGWGQADLAAVLIRPLPTVNEIIKGKKAVTPEMAVALGRAFGTSPDLWAHREAAYRLSLVKDNDDDETRKKALLFEMVPIKDLQRRGWINPEALTAVELENELTRFLNESPFSDSMPIAAVARQTFPSSEFSNSQRAWLMQSSHLARKVNTKAYDRDTLISGLPKVKKLTAKPEFAAKVPIILAELGIRVIVVEDLPRTKIDGAAYFLDGDASKPVIALSLRIDRMESFWHTLAHELRHIINSDPLSLDSDLVGEDRERQLAEFEKRADHEASNWLIAESDMRSFVLRTKPFFSKESIQLFANRMGVHPCIVVGHLQHLGAIGWDRYADLRPKIRDHLITTASCDGYQKNNYYI